MNDCHRTSDLLDLSGHSVLVTGASGNIGAGIAARLAEAGARIIAHYRGNRASAEALADSLGDAIAVGADLGDDVQAQSLFAEHRPDLVVNNAAIQPVQMLADMSVDEWRAMQRANLDSAFFVTRHAAREWQARGHEHGAIVNIASIEGSDPAPGHAHYATSKAALLMFTKAAALEFGPAGIRINAVSPGLVHREGLEADWPEGVEQWQSLAPLGRLGTAKDVADAVLFLLSPASRWISGVNLVVDGGMSCRSRW